MCQNCPHEQGVRVLLEGFDVMESLLEQINCKQWVTVDHCSLTEKVENSSDFIESLSKSISNLTKHHFTGKHQTEYLKKLKTKLQIQEGCLVGDFEEKLFIHCPRCSTRISLGKLSIHSTSICVLLETL